MALAFPDNAKNEPSARVKVQGKLATFGLMTVNPPVDAKAAAGRPPRVSRIAFSKSGDTAAGVRAAGKHEQRRFQEMGVMQWRGAQEAHLVTGFSAHLGRCRLQALHILPLVRRLAQAQEDDGLLGPLEAHEGKTPGGFLGDAG